MVVAANPELLVLHTLRLKGFVDAGVLAAAASLPDPDVTGVLDRLAARGLAAYRSGRITGWSLTAEGRREGERLLAEELDEVGCRDLVFDCYRRFRDLNEPLLQACTRWQLRGHGDAHLPNDHADPIYDAAVIGELDAVDDAVQPLCHALADVLPRFGYYNGRLAVARLRVHDGEHEWFAMPMIDSYHTVWFELHENLLATLNLERSAEYTENEYTES